MAGRVGSLPGRGLHRRGRAGDGVALPAAGPAGAGPRGGHGGLPAVWVDGTVAESDQMTQLVAVTRLERCGAATVPPPREVRLPVPNPARWEALEGMRVHLAGPLTVTGVYELGRTGELTLADARLFTPTQGAGTATPTGARRIVLDDGSRRQDPRPAPSLLPDGRPPRAGDRVSDVTAVVVQAGAGDYLLEPTAAPTLHAANARPSAPRPVAGEVRVATFNVHNFFTTLGERGARSRAQLRLQRAKLAAALAGLDADAIALQEVENDGMRSVDALLAALNARLGSDAYAAVPDPRGGVGGDRIRQAVLYRRARLELVATASDPRPIFERAPVAATFRTVAGDTFTLVDVHLKSKGGCPAAGDVDRGYGCWNLRRSAQAQAVLAFADRLAQQAGDPDVLVAGDLNSYAGEPPLRLFADAGYASADRLVPAARRYSYVFRGLSGTLDYLLASPSLAPKLAGATIWHIDADESPLAGAFAMGGEAAYVRPDAFRASDHDPVIVGLRGTSKGSSASARGR
ncbi:MAG: ExeM/NucH family extracellular endonuclease [Deinococcales bacterium]